MLQAVMTPLPAVRISTGRNPGGDDQTNYT